MPIRQSPDLQSQTDGLRAALIQIMAAGYIVMASHPQSKTVSSQRIKPSSVAAEFTVATARH